MITLISPTKTMVESPLNYHQVPIFNKESLLIFNELNQLDFNQAKKVYKASDKIVYKSLEMINNYHPCGAAIFSFKGASFKSMNVDSWSKTDLEYANTHLIILSSLFGLHKPFDTIAPYRLDYLSDISIDLYDYWTEYVTAYINSLQMPIINLASKEYSNSVDFSKIDGPVINIEFKEFDGVKYTAKSTYVKSARGAFVQEIIKNKVRTVNALKSISVHGYEFQHDLSNDSSLVYIHSTNQLEMQKV